MKLLAVLIFGFLVVGTLGQKNPSKPSGRPQQGPPRRPPRPPPASPEKREDDKEKGVGWGPGSGSGWGWNSQSVLPDPNYVLTQCVDPSTIVQANYDADFFSRPRLWYVTGDTKYYYIMNERIFLGVYPQTNTAMNQMCFAQFSSLDVQINSGYGVQFQQIVTLNEDGTFQDTINTDPSTYDGSLGVQINAAFGTHQGFLVATDNQTYAVYYLCVDGLYGSFELVTTRPYASPEAAGAFAAQADTYGFPRDQLQLLPCNSAYEGPYPYPFENYPNGWSSGNGWSNNSTGWGTAPSNGWNQNPPSNGWNSDHQPSGWNSQPNGWSNNHNNGWLAEKEAEVKEEHQKVAEPKPKKSERKFHKAN